MNKIIKMNLPEKENLFAEEHGKKGWGKDKKKYYGTDLSDAKIFNASKYKKNLENLETHSKYIDEERKKHIVADDEYLFDENIEDDVENTDNEYEEEGIESNKDNIEDYEENDDSEYEEEGIETQKDNIEDNEENDDSEYEEEGIETHTDNKEDDVESDYNEFEEEGIESDSDEMKEDLYDSDGSETLVKYEEFFGKKEDENKQEKSSIKENRETNKSSFEKLREKEEERMRELELKNIQEKDWYLTGEATKYQRPEDSALDSIVQTTHVRIPVPLIDEELNTRLEKIILMRVRSKAFQDPVRKQRPVIESFDFRKPKVKLDDAKSKKSLEEVYLEEYFKKKDAGLIEAPSFMLTGYQTPKNQDKKITNLQRKVATICRTLNSLTNCNYTPFIHTSDTEIVNLMPSVTTEEAAPVNMSDYSMLNRREIIAPLKGDLKGTNEATETDRKRARRKKKSALKFKNKIKNKNLHNNLKKTGNGREKQKASIDFVEKAVKKGHVKVLNASEPRKKKRKLK